MIVVLFKGVQVILNISYYYQIPIPIPTSDTKIYLKKREKIVKHLGYRLFMYNGAFVICADLSF